MFTLFIASARTSTYLICDNKSLLFAKDASVKASNYKVVTFNLTYVSPLAGFLICQARRQLSAFTSSLFGLIT